jgi:hypothetical protein
VTEHNPGRGASDSDILLPPGSEHGSSATMPGWHIYADLTPPELMADRRVRSLRVWIAIALVLVVAGVALAYDHARGQVSDAEEAVAAEQATGQSLREQQQQFAGVLTLQATVDKAKQDLAALMGTEVDIDALLGTVWDALPDGMTISQIAVSIPDQVSGKSPSGDRASAGVASLDTSDDAHIGTVTLAGSGATIDDLPAFIDNLSAIDGVFSPYPTSNQQSDDGGTSYSLQFTLTDALLTHRYAAEGEN